MSIYDKITTAKDLVLEVKAHGLSTKQEDICRAQDIFGHSTIEELEALATDNGRRDKDGNPDQFGNWSSGKDGTQKFFYQIIFTIWNWEDATKYYNEHSNPFYIEGREAVKKCETLAAEIKRQEERLDVQIKARAESDTKRQAALNKQYELNEELKAEIEAKDAEIIKLKASLYDLISK